MTIRDEELMADMAELDLEGSFSSNDFAVFHEAVMAEVESGALKLPESEDNSSLIRDIALDRMFAKTMISRQEPELHKKTPTEVEEELALEHEWNFESLLEVV